jgi:DNA-binding MarR family transcriptional regulator
MSNGPLPPRSPIAAGSHEERVLRALRRIIRAIDLQSRRLEHEVGLTGPQLICLRVLTQHGPMTAGALARAVDLSQATLTGILDRLVKRRLVTRRRSSKDRRRVTVALTAEGERLVHTAPSPLQARFSARLRELPERTQARLCTTLEQVVRMMDAEGLDAAAMLTPGSRVASGRHPAVTVSGAGTISGTGTGTISGTGTGTEERGPLAGSRS